MGRVPQISKTFPVNKMSGVPNEEKFPSKQGQGSLLNKGSQIKESLVSIEQGVSTGQGVMGPK